MIIESLMSLVYKLLSVVISPVNIPGLDASSQASMTEFIGWLSSAAGFFKLVLPINFTAYFVIFFALFAWDHLYPFIMWVLRKIPFLGIE